MVDVCDDGDDGDDAGDDAGDDDDDEDDDGGRGMVMMMVMMVVVVVLMNMRVMGKLAVRVALLCCLFSAGSKVQARARAMGPEQSLHGGPSFLVFFEGVCANWPSCLAHASVEPRLGGTKSGSWTANVVHCLFPCHHRCAGIQVLYSDPQTISEAF